MIGKLPDSNQRELFRPLLLADKMVDLEYIDSISHETIRQVLKKRIKTVEEKRLGYSTFAKR